MIGIYDSARQHGPVGSEPLAGHNEAEFVKTAKGGEAGAGQASLRGSVSQVEVFQMVV